MTYDNWKCTDPNDQWLGPEPIVEAFRRFHDGDISLDELGEIILEQGFSPGQVRTMVAETYDYLIPKGYFGKE